jgi:hypothetical protein
MSYTYLFIYFGGWDGAQGLMYAKYLLYYELYPHPLCKMVPLREGDVGSEENSALF